MTPGREDGELGRAIEAIRSTLQGEPSNGPFHYALAALLALSGRREEARLPLERAEALGVRTEVLRAWLGCAQASSRSQDTSTQATDETTS